MSSIWMGCALVCHSPMQVTVTWLCSRLDMVRVPYLGALQVISLHCVPMHEHAPTCLGLLSLRPVRPKQQSPTSQELPA